MSSFYINQHNIPGKDDKTTSQSITTITLPPVTPNGETSAFSLKIQQTQMPTSLITNSKRFKFHSFLLFK